MIYIIGKYSQLPRLYAVAKFNATESMLHSFGIPNEEIINPVKLVPEGTEWETAMTQYCLPAVRKADAVFIQRDFVDSPGAAIEINEAIKLGKVLFHEDSYDMKALRATVLPPDLE